MNTYTTGNQFGPVLSADAAGNFVASWTGASEQDGSSYGVFAQRFSTDVIFRDNFDALSLTAWSSSMTDGGDGSASPDAALDSSAAGLQVVVDDTASVFVQDDRPSDEDRYRVRFYFDPNGLDPGEALSHRRLRLFVAFESAPSRRLAAIVLRRVNGSYGLMSRCRRDDNSQADSGFFPITDAPHFVELDWRRSNGADALDGSCQLWIDGTSVATLTGLDNSGGAVDFVRLGALSVKSGANGALFWDEFESRRESYIGP